MTPNSILKIDHISQQFKEEGDRRVLQVLHDVSLEVTRGEFVALIGPSGSGKSTLLRIVAGFVPPGKGAVESRAKQLSMVFQNFAIFPWLTVRENIEFGLKMQGMAESKRHKIVQEKIEDVKLVGFEDTYPRELSGGMKQRVGIARALTMLPDLLLMDEPFSALDELTAEKLRHDLLAVWEKYQMTVIMVTHLVEEAVQMADRVAIFSAPPASIKKVVSVGIPRPRNKRSSEYFALVDEVSAEIQ